MEPKQLWSKLFALTVGTRVRVIRRFGRDGMRNAYEEIGTVVRILSLEDKEIEHPYYVQFDYEGSHKEDGSIYHVYARDELEVIA